MASKEALEVANQFSRPTLILARAIDELRIRDLEHLAKRCESEARVYEANSKACDEGGNTLGAHGDTCGALACRLIGRNIASRIAALRAEMEVENGQ